MREQEFFTNLLKLYSANNLEKNTENLISRKRLQKQILLCNPIKEKIDSTTNLDLMTEWDPNTSP